MLTANIAIVAPVTEADDRAAREVVWQQVTERIVPQMGTLCTRFEPSAGAWGQKVSSPYSVILGRNEPALFLYFYASAKRQLDECAKAHFDGFMEHLEFGNEQTVGNTKMCTAYFKGDTEKKIIMKDVILYMSKRAELTFSKLALNRVKISLYDVVKTTGELKDVFRFTYNGRRYDRLSLSEKIRAGAEVSELVKRLTGRNYPVFFDNMESVDDLSNIRPTSQMILAKCVHNAELSVRAGGQTMPKAA